MNTEIKEMEIADYNILHNIKASLYRLWKLKLVVILSTIFAALVAVIYLTISGDEFSFYSSATIYSAVYGSYSETVSGVSIMNTYSGILGSTRVCERAAAELNDSSVSASYLQSLVGAGKISISGASMESKYYGYRLVLNTRLGVPDKVVDITNAMANAFTSEINELLGEDIIQVFDQAKVPFMSSGTSDYIIIAVFAVVGLVLSAILIVAIEFFKTKVYIVSQCERDKNMILGILPYVKAETK